MHLLAWFKDTNLGLSPCHSGQPTQLQWARLHMKMVSMCTNVRLWNGFLRRSNIWKEWMQNIGSKILMHWNSPRMVWYGRYYCSACHTGVAKTCWTDSGINSVRQSHGKREHALCSCLLNILKSLLKVLVLIQLKWEANLRCTLVSCSIHVSVHHGNCFMYIPTNSEWTSALILA